MRVVKKALALLYLVAAIGVVGSAYSLLFSVDSQRLAAFLSEDAGRLLASVLLGAVALGALVHTVAIWAQRPEPASIRLGGDQAVEVSLTAVLSVARTAAMEHDVLVERCWGRIKGRERDSVEITLELIAFTDTGLEALAHAVRQRVSRACEDMLGVSCATVRVRFLPAKTTVVTKEA